MRSILVLTLALGFAGGTLVPTAAHAQEQVCQPYSQPVFRADLDKIQKSLQDMDLRGMRATLSDVRIQIRCLDEIVNPSMLAEFARLMALVFFFDQDADSTRRWGLLARYADPDLPWDDAMFPEDHPFRTALEEEDDPILGGPTDMGLLPPAKGGIFMNGQFLARAEAPAEVPLFMQVADKKGTVVAGFWQDGARFPDPILGPPGGVVEPPKWWAGPTAAAAEAVAVIGPEPEPVVPNPEPEPQPHGEGLFADGVPVTRLAIAGGLLVGSGVLLAVAGASAAGLDNTTDPNAPGKIRTTTNLCTLSAIALAAGGIGVGASVFFIEDGAGLGLSVRW